MVTVKDREVEGLKKKVKEQSGVSLTDKEAHTLRDRLKEKSQ